ncbi:MAG: NAD(P)-dependent alcohol dehydrogenase [Euryarchaeota archaeon]|nr:NAD(P)-dependent alcohol dehydrogenase [Euryarchaeota archaeon]
MKAVLVTKYGGPEVLQVKEVPTPSPKENEVLIKIHAAAVNNTDPIIRKGKPFFTRFFTGLSKPKYSIPGDVLAGEIVEIGQSVTKFKTGARVYGYSTDTLGAHAEYKCLSEDSAIVNIPENISYEEAAGIVDGGFTALVFLRDKGEIKNKQKVLVYGASGSVGTAAVQIAISYGAEVTGVCSTTNIEMVQLLGAKRVIDYTKNDFTRENNKYDIIFDTVAKKSFSECQKVLTENGIYLSTFPSAGVMIKGLFQSKDKGKRALFVAAGIRPVNEKINNLHYLSELLKDKKIKTIIDRRYSLNDIVEAHRYVETGHKKGNVILSICQ